MRINDGCGSNVLKDLNQEEIKYYLSLLKEELTDYDCGALCSPYNNGTPYCCSAENAVPLLYKSELAHLNSLGEMWSVWKPKTKEDREIAETASRDQVFCECKGIGHCSKNRHLRSVSCRTFPLEPYVDKRGVFVGLTFVREFTQRDPESGRIKCPMTKRKKDIRQQFVDAHFIFWEKILFRREEEYETYIETSRRLRLEKNRSGKTFAVLFPSHLQDSKMAKQFLY